MLNTLAEDMRKDRANFACEVEYLKETAKDDIIDARMETTESQYFGETIEELEEAANWADRIDTSKEDEVKEEEVNRILNAEEDLTFTEMADI